MTSLALRPYIVFLIYTCIGRKCSIRYYNSILVRGVTDFTTDGHFYVIKCTAFFRKELKVLKIRNFLTELNIYTFGEFFFIVSKHNAACRAIGKTEQNVLVIVNAIVNEM